MAHKYSAESKKKFIEKMQHDLKFDSRFTNVVIDTNHLRFIFITGEVSSAEEKLALHKLIQTNRRTYFAPVGEDVTVLTNLNK